jgi:hypothetical protein
MHVRQLVVTVTGHQCRREHHAFTLSPALAAGRGRAGVYLYVPSEATMATGRGVRARLYLPGHLAGKGISTHSAACPPAPLPP